MTADEAYFRMLEPPAADRDLSVDIVRRVLEAQFPTLNTSSVRHLGSGWEYDAYLVGESRVIRFPRYAAVAAGLDRAEAVLTFLDAQVLSGFGIPKITVRGVPSADFPHRFLGHELIPGVSADQLEAPASMELARDLGMALTALHSVPLASVRELGVGSQKWNCRTAFDGLVVMVDQVEALRDLAPVACGWVDRQPALPEEYGGLPRLLHDDLQPEHIIVDPHTSRLTGIIDWGLATGDPAQDLTFILPWWGWEFTAELLRTYDAPTDPDFVERLDFLARVRALGSLGHAISLHLGTAAALRMIGNAFSGTSSAKRI